MLEKNEQSFDDISAKIDALGNREEPIVNQQPNVQETGEIRAEPPAAEKPVDPQFKYNYPEPIYKGHRALVEAGVDPHEIPHVVRGRQRGCQCFSCKSDRGEVFEVQSGTVADKEGAQVIDPILSDLLSEEVIADILNMPRQIAIFVAELKKAPLEVQRALEIDVRRLKMYGKWGKHLADHYLRLPSFKNKELIIFSIWWGYDNAISFTKAVLAYKIHESQKESVNDKR